MTRTFSSIRWNYTIAFFLTITLTNSIHSQGTKADYERAEKLQARSRDGVIRSSVKPNWFSGNDRFWYRNDLADGVKEYLVVEAISGKREEPFDKTRLAKAIAQKENITVDPNKLDLKNLTFSENGLELQFEFADKSYRSHLKMYELIEIPRTSNSSVVDDVPRLSRNTGKETELVLVNKTPGTLRLFWFDSEGRRQSYGEIESGATHRQHTFSGHVWILVDRQSNEFGPFQAKEDPRRLEIDGKTANETASPQNNPRSRRNPRSNQSPDGKYEARIKDHNLLIRDIESDQESQLSMDGQTDDSYRGPFLWSPDSSRLMLFQEKPAQEHKVSIVESSPKDQLQPKLQTYDYLKPGDRIAHPRPKLFNIPDKKQVPINDELFPNPWSLSEYHWSPDSSEFSMLYNERGHQTLRVVAIDAQNGKPRSMIEEKSPTFIDYSNKTFLSYIDNTNEIIWMSERSGWNHLYLIDTKTGTVKNAITSGSWLVRRVEKVDIEKRQVLFQLAGYFHDQDPYYIHYARVNFDGTDLTLLTEGEGTHQIQFSPDGRFLIDTYSRVDQPAIIELRRSSDGKLICELERADWSKLLATGWQVPERFVAKGRDNQTDIHGIIWRPTNFDKAKTYPVIEHIYAGPQGAFVPKNFAPFYRTQTLAELGFIVVQIDGMGTNWRSKSFHDRCWKNLADAGFLDRIAWLKAVGSKYPQLDLTKVGLYGGSAGGQNALAGLLHHGEFYKVAASDCGCHDNRMDKIWWNEAWMGWPIGPEYAESSNVTHAAKLSGKLLLTVGELDKNVDPASTMQVVNALIRANRDFEFVIFPGGGHGSGESPYGDRKRKDFFVRHLLGVEPRSN